MIWGNAQQLQLHQEPLTWFPVVEDWGGLLMSTEWLHLEGVETTMHGCNSALSTPCSKRQQHFRQGMWDHGVCLSTLSRGEVLVPSPSGLSPGQKQHQRFAFFGAPIAEAFAGLKAESQRLVTEHELIANHPPDLVTHSLKMISKCVHLLWGWASFPGHLEMLPLGVLVPIKPGWFLACYLKRHGAWPSVYGFALTFDQEGVNDYQWMDTNWKTIRHWLAVPSFTLHLYRTCVQDRSGLFLDLQKIYSIILYNFSRPTRPTLWDLAVHLIAHIRAEQTNDPEGQNRTYLFRAPYPYGHPFQRLKQRLFTKVVNLPETPNVDRGPQKFARLRMARSLQAFQRPISSWTAARPSSLHLRVSSMRSQSSLDPPAVSCQIMLAQNVTCFGSMKEWLWLKQTTFVCNRLNHCGLIRHGEIFGVTLMFLADGLSRVYLDHLAARDPVKVGGFCGEKSLHLERNQGHNIHRFPEFVFTDTWLTWPETFWSRRRQRSLSTKESQQHFLHLGQWWMLFPSFATDSGGA